MTYSLILILCLPAGSAVCERFYSVRIDSLPDRAVCEQTATDFQQRNTDYRSHLCVPQVRT